jgi:hypothetical protein
VVGVYGREYSKCTTLREQDGVFRLPLKVVIELRLFSARRLRVWRDVAAFTVTHGSESASSLLLTLQKFNPLLGTRLALLEKNQAFRSVYYI